VFISHSSLDRWIAKTMAEKLRRRGVETWIDEIDLDAGAVVVNRILEGVDACHEAVILVSPNSALSQWVAFEIGAARSQRKRVTPVLCNVDHKAISPLQDVKALELNDFDVFLRQLRTRLDRRRKKK